MASFALKSLFCFIVAVFCFIDHNVEAREGKLFFTEFTHLDRTNNNTKMAQPPAAAPELAQVNGRLGDGPFGAGSGMIPQTKESWPDSSTTTDAEFEKLMDTFDEANNKKLPEEFEEDEYNNNNNNGYSYNNYNENRRVYGNEEEEERQEMSSDTRGYESGRGNDHPNEFETMEEYYKSLEGSQEEYEP